jgi:hypothetical protein
MFQRNILPIFSDGSSYDTKKLLFRAMLTIKNVWNVPLNMEPITSAHCSSSK